MSKRFSKATIMDYIARRTEQLRAEHRLDPGNGTAQLRGRSTETAVAYGEFRALLDLRDAIDGQNL